MLYNIHNTKREKGVNMCTNGVNTGQFDQMIDQIDEHIRLERKWTHTLAHQAEDAQLVKTGETLPPRPRSTRSALCSPMRKTPSKMTPKHHPAYQ